MTFDNADQMFEHLAAYVFDEVAVVRAVQRQFPKFRLDVRKKDNAANPWLSSAARDLQDRTAIASASTKLLQAIHKQHPEIMKALAAQGKGVVYP